MKLLLLDMTLCLVLFWDNIFRSFFFVSSNVCGSMPERCAQYQQCSSYLIYDYILSEFLSTKQLKLCECLGSFFTINFKWPYLCEYNKQSVIFMSKLLIIV